MTKAFLNAFKEVLGYEGGYTDEPNDNGNWTGGKKDKGELKGTKYGISAASYPTKDIKNLTLEDAQAIYYIDFWHQLRLDEITDYQIQLEIFDTSVNCGVNTAAIMAQKALSFLGAQTAIDGVMGSRTIAALNLMISHDPEALHKALNGYQFMHYERIVINNPSQLKFARGWLKRIQYYRRQG